MNVTIIGPGRAGTTIAAALVRAGHRVTDAGGGQEASRDAFARHIAGVRMHADPLDAVSKAELIVLATPDDQVEYVADELAANDKLVEGVRVVHLAGSRGTEILRRARLAGARVAACHPAQTMPSGPPDPDRIVGIGWAVTTADADRGWAHELVESLGGTPVDVAEEDRVLYHAALTVGSNAIGAAVAVARQLLMAAGVDDPSEFLGALVRSSANNVLERGAVALTGPVVRGDTGTLAAHLHRLDADLPHLAVDYRRLLAVVLSRARPNMDPHLANEVADLLAMPDSSS
jgi:predicted short-subunit dehydrogenase-like oxidoreductase (DUF2520 family)